MFELKKTFTISAAHKLIDYPGDCAELHGHNWKITVYCRSKELNVDGMIMDFADIKSLVTTVLDHAILNEFIEQPTAENVAKWVCDRIGEYCYMVEVEETEGSVACYIK